MSEVLEQDIELLQKLATTFKDRGGDFHMFDAVIYELCEASIIEPPIAALIQDVWDGKEIQECENCSEFTTRITVEKESGYKLCTECIEWEIKYERKSNG